VKRLPLAAIALAGVSQVVCGQPGDDTIARLKSCLQLEGAVRADCLDKLSREMSAERPPVPAQPTEGNWIISETTSPVDYSPQITAAISSESAVKDAPSSFSIRCRGGRTELFVSTIGSWRPSNNGEFKVAYRINEQPAVEEQWAAFAGRRGALFKGDVTKFLRSLLEGGQLSIRVFDWQGPPHEATFQMSGFDVVRQKFAPVCKW
jgi:hypothetical protein